MEPQRASTLLRAALGGTPWDLVDVDIADGAAKPARRSSTRSTLRSRALHMQRSSMEADAARSAGAGAAGIWGLAAPREV
jgi:hypothetical protein